MNKFQFIAVAFFLVAIIFSTKNSYSQKPDTLAIRKGDSLFYRQSDSLMGIDPDNDTLIMRPTEVAKKDTSHFLKKKKQWSSPKKAMVWAMVLPGAGQAYNRKFWKMPILYIGAGILAYFWVSNNYGYQELKNEYKTVYLNTQYDLLNYNTAYTFQYVSYTNNFTYTNINQLSIDRDTYHRYRDMAIAGSVILYVVSILDAYVDAHLKDFDLSPDLSMSVRPMFYKYNSSTFTPGISIGFKF
ncbi:MAG TPA: DUF5683 domain-containing protein [Cytophagaceae bacterium]|jgi:hypothetical protein|nr:DUF5683 domain-containing protein [Cytophagaceae bacterium]